MIKLSIIIPMYNTEPYIDELLKALAPQLTDETELIVVDDGSNFPFLPPYPSIKVFRHEHNKGVSAARNTGLKHSHGQYIVFIDSDDMVAPDYLSHIFKSIENEPDTVYISWKSMCGRFGKTIRNASDKFGSANRCVWNRVFKKTYIKGMKFDETMMVAEDDDFLKRLPEPKSHTYIAEPIYFYRVGRNDGLSVRKAKGEFDEPDVTTQIVLYYSHVQQIGGVETFFYNFCSKMTEFYDIAILYDRCDPVQINRLRKLVPCYHSDVRIKCDTLIMNGIFDEIPQKVTAKCKIRLIHTCRIDKYGICSVPDDCDKVFFVSEASKNSFDAEGVVIPNLPGEISDRKALILLSATRLTNEKGFERMLHLAKRFRQNNIPFIWLVFTSINNRVFPEDFVKLPPTLDIKPYIAKADYLVQLSDVEAFCYSIQESLQAQIPVLTTPFDAIKEVGVEDGKNGYIIPFNIEELTDKDIQKIYKKIPKCGKYADNSAEIIEQWRAILGNSTPTHSYIYNETEIMIRCKCNFFDVNLNKRFTPGQTQITDTDRAKYLVEVLKAWDYV